MKVLQSSRIQSGFQIAKAMWQSTSENNIGLVSAGVSFYAFLALVPTLAVLVLGYGMFAPQDFIVSNMAAVSANAPREIAAIINDQLMSVVSASDDKKGLGLLIAVIIAISGAMNGSSAVITALNIAYQQTETRGFLKTKFVALAVTIAVVTLAFLVISAASLLGFAKAILPASSGFTILLVSGLTYLLFTGIAAAAVATLYRYAPDHEHGRWVWITPGTILAATLWLGISLGFGYYATNFGNFGATYGSLAGIVVFLTWLYLFAYVLILGAELNAQIERRGAPVVTVKDHPDENRSAVDRSE